MARWKAPSLLFALALATLLPDSASNDEFFRNGLGTLGFHYNLKRGRPYIQCHTWNDQTKDNNLTMECAPNGTNDSFFGKKLGCNGVFKIKNPEKYMGRNMAGKVLDKSEYDRHAGGCWMGEDQVHEQCESEKECIALIKKPDESKNQLIAFCCCTTHECNSKVTVMFPRPNGTTDLDDEGSLMNATADAIVSTTSVAAPSASVPFWVFVWIFVFILAMFTVCICVFKLTNAKQWLRMLNGGDQKKKKADEVPLVTIDGGWKRNNLKEGLTVEEAIAEGRGSIVHKGTYKDPDTGKERTIALKKIADQKSFILEEAVYRAAQNSHNHLAHFLGSNFESGNFYVVMEYYENGSLENYLKTTTFTPLESLTFLSSLMDGLAFLHAPCTLPNGGYKSAIMHRDLKSRNVLVKADRTAAIVDFGLAMVCEGNRPYGRHYQVGTHRYMSPELLISMANLNMDGLKMADVYAVSLIIWEILNRTIIDEEDEVRPAELPYEAELQEAMAEDEEKFRSTNPNGNMKEKILYYLKNIVHRDNRRPVMRERLKENPITAELVKTTLDMWDFEVDGRISAACAHARLSLLRKDAIAGTIPRLS